MGTIVLTYKLILSGSTPVLKTNMLEATDDWGDDTPVQAVAEAPEVKLFGRWSTAEVQVNDISLTDYIAVKEKHAKYLPHSAGRYQVKRFRKAQCPIVERLTSSLMMHGRNNGKKIMTMRIVKHAFEIIHLLTGENPLQVVSMQSSILVLVKTLHVLVVLELYVVRLLMCPLFAVLTRQSGCCVQVLGSLRSET